METPTESVVVRPSGVTGSDAPGRPEPPRVPGFVEKNRGLRRFMAGVGSGFWARRSRAPVGLRGHGPRIRCDCPPSKWPSESWRPRPTTTLAGHQCPMSEALAGGVTEGLRCPPTAGPWRARSQGGVSAGACAGCGPGRLHRDGSALRCCDPFARLGPGGYMTSYTTPGAPGAADTRDEPGDEVAGDGPAGQLRTGGAGQVLPVVLHDCPVCARRRVEADCCFPVTFRGPEGGF